MLQQIPQIRKIAEQAGRLIMPYFQNTSLVVQQKSDDSPVTAADLAANNLIVSELRKISSEVIISEESDADRTSDLHDKRFWLVDPLDGTRDFVAGRPSFCVSIALIEKRKPILGVIFAPATDELYWAVRGHGAFFGDVKIFNNSTRTELLAVASGSTNPSERMKKFLEVFGVTGLKRYGSATKLVHLARGDADLYPRFGPTSEWDTAAGQIIAEEAGCTVLDLKTMAPLEYTKQEFRNEGFFAVRSDLAEHCIQVIQTLRLETKA